MTREQPRRHDLPRPADHDRDGPGVPRRGAAHDGVRRRRARAGRRRGRAPQAAHSRRKPPPTPPEAAMLNAVNVVAAFLVGLVAAAARSGSWCSRCSSGPRPTGPPRLRHRRRLRRADQGAGGQPGPLQRLPRRRPGLGPGRRTRPTCSCSSSAASSSPASTAPPRSTGGSCWCRRCRRRRARRGAGGPLRLSSGAGSSPDSSQPRNASRFWVGSPRSLRHSHSLRIEEAKPSSRIELNDSSAWLSTDPSSRSSSSAVTAASGSRASR